MPLRPETATAYAAGTTIGVELFDRDRRVLERNLEPVLHDSITLALLDYQGFTLRPAAEAELVLRGTLLDYRRRGGVRSPDFKLLETGLFLRFRAELVERVSGTIVASSEPQTWSSYALDGVERESTARERGYDFLARKLVFELFSEAGRVEFSESQRTSPPLAASY